MKVRSAFIGSDMGLELELASAMQEMTNDYTFTNVSLIKNIVAEHVTSVEGSHACLIPGAAPSVLAGQLETQECFAGWEHNMYNTPPALMNV